MSKCVLILPSSRCWDVQLLTGAPLLQCLMYKTDQQVDVKRMEQLNTIFFAMMSKGSFNPGETQLCTHTKAAMLQRACFMRYYGQLHNT